MQLFAQHFSSRHTVYVLAGLSLLWAVAFGVFNYVLPQVGWALDYSREPLLTAAYWLMGVAVAFAFFPNTLHKTIIRHSADAYGLLALFVAFLAFFYALVVPTLDPFVRVHGVLYEAGFLGAAPMYLLPKLADILFQQVIIAAFILTLASYCNSVSFVAGWYAAFFVTMHLLLWFAFGFGLTLIFTAGAIVSVICFPYLIMRVNNGFVYSYMLHWCFYLCITLLLRW